MVSKASADYAPRATNRCYGPYPIPVRVCVRSSRVRSSQVIIPGDPGRDAPGFEIADAITPAIPLFPKHDP